MVHSPPPFNLEWSNHFAVLDLADGFGYTYFWWYRLVNNAPGEEF